MKKYGEPWKEDDDCISVSKRSDGGDIACDAPAQEWVLSFEHWSIRRKRIVDCVNACEGMYDPAQEIQNMRDVLKLAFHFIKKYTPDDHAPDCLVMCGLGAECDCGDFKERRDVLNVLQPFV